MRYLKLFLVIILMAFSLLSFFFKGHSGAQLLRNFEIRESISLMDDVFVKAQEQISEDMAHYEGHRGLGGVKLLSGRMMFETVHSSFHSLYFQDQLNHSPPSLSV